MFEARNTEVMSTARSTALSDVKGVVSVNLHETVSCDSS